MPVFSLSIVSHGHAGYIESLLRDLAALARTDFDVILTINLPEHYSFDFGQLPFAVAVINNRAPKGFAANHNAAFLASSGANFVILNPDIALLDDPFVGLVALMEEVPGQLYAPMVVNHAGEREDSMRFFPSPWLLIVKLLAKLAGRTMRIDAVPQHDAAYMPDWVAGMFVVVPRPVYAALAGLNERYHMYYEDVDFCARARLAGHRVLVSKNAKVIHEAQRDSHRKLRYLLWHIHSAAKFFLSPAYLKLSFGRASRLAQGEK